MPGWIWVGRAFTMAARRKVEGFDHQPVIACAYLSIGAAIAEKRAGLPRRPIGSMPPGPDIERSLGLSVRDPAATRVDAEPGGYARIPDLGIGPDLVRFSLAVWADAAPACMVTAPIITSTILFTIIPLTAVSAVRCVPRRN